MHDFIVNYKMDGADWIFVIKAESWGDANRRLSHIKSWARLDGQLMGVYPAKMGWWVKLRVRLGNWLRVQ